MKSFLSKYAVKIIIYCAFVYLVIIFVIQIVENKKAEDNSGDGTVISQTATEYNLGEKLSFSLQDQSGIQYCVGGLSVVEQDFTWTDGKELTMHFPSVTSDIGKDLMVSVQCGVYNGAQTVNIYANENHIDSIQLSGDEGFSFTIPKEFLTNDWLKLRLELPDAISPMDAEGADDGRVLGLSLRSIMITDPSAEAATDTLAEYVPGTTLNFNASDSTGVDYTVGGLSVVEQDFTWTDGKELTMHFPSVTSEIGKDLVVTVQCGVYNGTQTVNIYANENHIDSIQLSGDEGFSFTIPKEFLTNDWLKLRLELPDAISPMDAEGASDYRVLALSMQSVVVDCVA